MQGVTQLTPPGSVRRPASVPGAVSASACGESRSHPLRSSLERPEPGRHGGIPYRGRMVIAPGPACRMEERGTAPTQSQHHKHTRFSM
jgi:hypothetical protein